MIYKPQKIIIEESVKQQPLTRRIVSKLPNVRVQTVEDAEEFLRSIRTLNVQINTLFLARQRGPFVRLCPGTPKHIVNS